MPPHKVPPRIRAAPRPRARLPLLDRLLDDAPRRPGRPADVRRCRDGHFARQRAAGPGSAVERPPALAVLAGPSRPVGAVQPRLRPARLYRRRAERSGATRTPAGGDRIHHSPLRTPAESTAGRLARTAATALEPRLRLRIEALLHAEPGDEPVTFETVVDATTAEVTLHEAGGHQDV